MEIEKAVETADAVIVCLSKNSVTKDGYVQRELKYILDIALEKPEGTIFIIPSRLDDCQVPRQIRGWQWVDFFPKSNWEFGYQKVIKSLEKRILNLIKISKGDEMLSDGSRLEWIQKNVIRVGKGKISETDYKIRNEKSDEGKKKNY